MARKVSLRRGDTDGDTIAAKEADSTPQRRRRKTKAPARIPGVEHRWSPSDGWRFRARMKVDGKIAVGSWTTREEAATERERMRQRRAESGGSAAVTFEEAAQDVLNTVPNEGTWRSYEEHFLVLGEFLGADTLLAAITPEDVRAFLASRRATRTRGKPPSELRLRKHLTALNRVFRLATTNGKFSGGNPIDRVEKPRPERTKPGVYVLDELQELLEVAEGWDRMVLATLFFSGLRRSELARVRVSQIDQQGGLIRDVVGKTGPRDIVITKPLKIALDALIAGAKDEFLIFGGTCRGPRKTRNRPSTPHDRRCSAIHRAMKRIRERVREHLRPRLHSHSMRHSLKTLLADRKVESHIRDAFLGHAPAGTPGRYEHASITMIRHEATRVLDPLVTLVAQPEKGKVAT